VSEQKPKRKPRGPKPLTFEVVSIGKPGPIAILAAQMIALGVEPARIHAAETRLRGVLEGRKKTA
jgi:hypothetical protein